MTVWMEKISADLERLRNAGSLRSVSHPKLPQGCIDLSDNDYLGLASDRLLREEFFDTVGTSCALSASASPLLMGESPAHESLQESLQQAIGKPVLLFGSGWQANTGFVSALGAFFKSSMCILADKLVHASMIDGMRFAVMNGAKMQRFAHNSAEDLERRLEKCRDFELVLVMIESIYSMDGDAAPLQKIAALKARFPNMVLAVDEAHGIGVFGANGYGLCEATGITEQVDIYIGTFGKALASSGAFVAADASLISFFTNYSRSLIFSTAEPPIIAAWTDFIVRKLPSFADRRANAAKLNGMIAPIAKDISTTNGLAVESSSQIIPVVIGSNEKTMTAGTMLLDSGFKVSVVRPPTVPAGTSRLRICLKASLSGSDAERLADALCKLKEAGQ